MITVNIRIEDVPVEAYETIRRRAIATGQLVGVYLRDQFIALASDIDAAEGQP